MVVFSTINVLGLLSTPNLIFWPGFWAFAGLAFGLPFVFFKRRRNGIVKRIILSFIFILIVPLSLVIAGVFLQRYLDAKDAKRVIRTQIDDGDDFMKAGLPDTALVVWHKAYDAAIEAGNDELRVSILTRLELGNAYKINSRDDTNRIKEIKAYQIFQGELAGHSKRLKICSDIWEEFEPTPDIRLQAEISSQIGDFFIESYEKDKSLLWLKTAIWYYSLAVDISEIELDAFVLISLGEKLESACMEHYVRTERKESLNLAVRTLDKIATNIKPEVYPCEYVRVKLVQGLTYFALTYTGDIAENLALAQDAFAQAEKYLDLDLCPTVWAMLCNNLGINQDTKIPWREILEGYREKLYPPLRPVQ